MARGQLILNPQAEESAEDDLAAAFAALGLHFDGGIAVDQDEYWLWPENEEIFWTWSALQTQWNCGMGGAVGLNYSGVESYLRMMNTPKKKRPQVLLLIQHMEQAALEEWAAKR